MFSKACEYGIRATIFIAKQSMQGDKASQKAIAEAIGGPVAFTAKTMQILTRANIVSSDRGPNGGLYFNEKQLDQVCLSDIVVAIDGSSVFKACGLGLKQCSEEKPCPVHFQFKEIREQLKEMLETTTIKHLTIGLNANKSFLLG